MNGVYIHQNLWNTPAAPARQASDNRADMPLFLILYFQPTRARRERNIYCAVIKACHGLPVAHDYLSIGGMGCAWLHIRAV